MGELDPLFTKALRLLHSRSRESVDQLAQLIEDVAAQRHNSGGGQPQAAVMAMLKVPPQQSHQQHHRSAVLGAPSHATQQPAAHRECLSL